MLVLSIFDIMALQELRPCGSEHTNLGADSTDAGPMARARHRAAERVKDLGDIFADVEYKARRNECWG
jgi:hypothetical protein